MKLINAQQTRIIHHYKNTTEKLLIANAAIRFNTMRLHQYLTPK
jgi:hypothetical protein